MRRFGVLLCVALAAMMTVGVGSAAALSGGGKKPSEAPLVTWGQHYEATLGNNQGEANYTYTSCCTENSQVAFWRLGTLNVHDQVVVNWHELPFAHETGFPVHLLLLENVEDFNWGSAFNGAVNNESEYDVSGSGSGRTEITVQNSSTNDYLVFFSAAYQTESQRFETYPYDFSVEAPRHYIGLSLGSVSKVAANGYLHATAALATGAPVPDGYPVTLTGTWSGGGVFTETATSVAGGITFPLALPETAFGKYVEFVASSPATTEYQAVSSSKVSAEVVKPPAPPAPPPAPTPVNFCKQDTNAAHVLARQYRRQLKNAKLLRGKHRRRALHRAHATERKFLAAQAVRKAAC